MIKLHFFFLAINKDFATMRGIDMSFVEMVSIIDSLWKIYKNQIVFKIINQILK